MNIIYLCSDCYSKFNFSEYILESRKYGLKAIYLTLTARYR